MTIGAVVGTGVYVLLGKLHSFNVHAPHFLLFTRCIVDSLSLVSRFFRFLFLFSTLTVVRFHGLPSGRLADKDAKKKKKK